MIRLALLTGFCLTCCAPAPKPMEEKMSPDRQYRATDPQSNLEASLTIVRASDGGVSAVGVELRNPSDRDVILRVNREMSAFIMLTVTDEHGTVLSKPARTFDTSETQRLDLLRLSRGSSHSWRVPIAAQLDVSKVPEPGLTGRLVVNVALMFSAVDHGEEPADADFQISIMTLFDMQTRFTRAALSADR